MPGGDAVAGTPRRIQHGVPRPDMIKGSAPMNTAAARVACWLERQCYLFSPTREQVRFVEELIADLNCGQTP